MNLDAVIVGLLRNAGHLSRRLLGRLVAVVPVLIRGERARGMAESAAHNVQPNAGSERELRV
jgi:hypothetical protein